MSADLIGNIANISLALSLIVGLVFGISQARAASRDRRERFTLETLSFIAARDFAEMIQYIDTHEMPKSRAELRALPVNEQTMFIQFSMIMENLGILVAEKMVNLDLVDETLGSFVVTTWAKFRPIAVISRQEDNEPFMSEYFQWLAETTDARFKANPRPPAYEKLPHHH
jgi:hypothetical protein